MTHATSCFGSDVHVMLTLHRRSRQVVVADEQLDGANVIGKFLGKRQRLAYQTGNTLSQSVVEPLDVIGFTS